MNIYRQGDVLFLEDNNVYNALASTVWHNIARDGQRLQRLIVAEGEATGHAHAVYDMDATLRTMETTGEVYLDAPSGATVVHEEHAPVKLPAGTFKVVIQREYSPQEIRRVLD